MDLSLFSPRPIGQDFIDGNVIPTIYCDLNGAGGSPTATVKSATWNLCYQPQGAYAPEVCTALTSAASGANVAVGTNALGAWSTPASAFLAHDTINYASVSVANPTSGQNTNWLVGTPQNSANLAAIDNNALISVVGFEFWADTVGLTNTGGQINAAIIIGGANFMNLTPATIALNVGVAWVLKSGTDLVIPSTAPITWAMFKAANCGVGLQWQSLGGNPNGSIKINGVRVKLCYTNPQSVGGGGMIWCEC
jgi:hypothetical protein